MFVWLCWDPWIMVKKKNKTKKTVCYPKLCVQIHLLLKQTVDFTSFIPWANRQILTEIKQPGQKHQKQQLWQRKIKISPKPSGFPHVKTSQSVAMLGGGPVARQYFHTGKSSHDGRETFRGQNGAAAGAANNVYYNDRPHSMLVGLLTFWPAPCLPVLISMNEIIGGQTDVLFQTGTLAVTHRRHRGWVSFSRRASASRATAHTTLTHWPTIRCIVIW